jgi:hypothetical protein
VAVRSYVAHIADQTGLDERTVMRDIQIANGVAADVVKIIFARRLQIANQTGSLLSLCKLKPAQQRRAVRAFANEGKDAFDDFVTNLPPGSSARTASGAAGGRTDRETTPSGTDGAGVRTSSNGAVQSREEAAPTTNGTTTTPTSGETHEISEGVAPAAARNGVPLHADATETGNQSTEQGGENSDTSAGTVNRTAPTADRNGSNGSPQPHASPTAIRDREALQIFRRRAEERRRAGGLFPSISDPVLDAEFALEDVRVRLGSQRSPSATP